MKFHHVALTVKNLDESIAFYKEFFNAVVAKSFERQDLQGKAAFLKLGEVHLELWEFVKGKQNVDDLKDLKIIGIRHIAFEVEELDKDVAPLRLKGLAVTEPKLGPSGHRYAFTQDPNGIRIELYEK